MTLLNSNFFRRNISKYTLIHFFCQRQWIVGRFVFMDSPFDQKLFTQYFSELFDLLTFFQILSRPSIHSNKIEMKQLKMRIVLIMAALIISTISSANLGQTILLNSGFQNPFFDTSKIPLVSYVSPVQGWDCHRQCQYVSIPFACSNIDSFYCPFISNNQMLNLKNVTQGFKAILASIYRFTFQWVPPLINQLNKSIIILFNDKIIQQISINSTQSIGLNNYSVQINITEGSNKIELIGMGLNDEYGFYIDNIYLQQILVDRRTRVGISGGSSGSSSNSGSGSSGSNSGSGSSGSSGSGSGSTSGSTSSGGSNTTSNVTSNTTNNSTYNTTSNSSGFNNESDSSNMESHSFSLLRFMMNNSLTSIINYMPGSRVFFNYITSFQCNFDRLQFYYYHKQNLTQYATMFLSAITIFKEQQGSLPQIIIQEQSSTPLRQFADTQNKMEQQLSFKNHFTSRYFQQKNQKGISFIANQFSFFYYQLPFMLLSHFVLWLFFSLTKEYRISVYFRKYCFLAIVFFLIFQGTLQQFAFYFFQECQLLTSSNIIHKFINTFIITFGFAIIFFVFGALLFFYGHYSKRAKYFIEDRRLELLSFISVSVDCGIAPLASAAIHAFFLENLLQTTVLLTMMEMIWIGARIYFINRKIYVTKIKVCIHIVSSALRIFFLVTLYSFQQGADYSFMNILHLIFMVSYLFLWVLQILFAFVSFVIGLVGFINKILRSNKVIIRQRNSFRMNRTRQPDQGKSIINRQISPSISLKRSQFKMATPRCSNFYLLKKQRSLNTKQISQNKDSQIVQYENKEKLLVLKRKARKGLKFKHTQPPKAKQQILFDYISKIDY